MAISEREQRGLAIAALCKLDKKDGAWIVPSQTGSGRYRVLHDGKAPKCNCPDFETRGQKCKHIFAVEYTIEREVHADGSETLTRSVTVTEKVTYSQNWPAYNDAQENEKPRFQALLADLCRGLPEPQRNASMRGRKPHLLRDAIFSMVFKVYSGFSARRFSSDLLDAHKAGYVSKAIPGLKVAIFLENPEYTRTLTELVSMSAAPLRVVDTAFAVDSTGFSTTRFERWFDEKYGTTKQKAVWVKVHAAIGVKTNCITAVRILDKDSGDCPEFAPLVRKTHERFTVNEVSGDKAYASEENFRVVAECGGTGFLAFKSNTTGGIGGLFEKMFHYFQFRREEFLTHYHQRSNAESAFSAVKRVFGDSVRCRTDAGMVNEVLCKLIAHHLRCLIHEQAELGIEAIFWENQAEAVLRNGAGCYALPAGNGNP
jgi:transposase